MRAKVAQEKLIEQSGLPYSIVRATLFFEFVDSIADSATEGNTVRLPRGAFQPIAASGDARQVVTDPAARYFGALIDDRTIVPLEDEGAAIYPTRSSDWMDSGVPTNQ